MTDNDTPTDDQKELLRETASAALELLELVRRQHHENGIDLGEAFEGLTTDNSVVILNAFLSVIDIAIRLGANGLTEQAYYGRLGVIREAVKEFFGGLE